MLKRITMGLLAVLLVLSLAACGNSGSNENLEPDNVSESGSDLTVDNSDTMDIPPEQSKVAFDVTQFAHISSQQLVSILGEPDNITQTSERGFTTFPCELYDYENHELGFLRFDIINDKVAAISINGELPYNGGNVLETLNVEIEHDDYFSEGDMYKKWECPTDTIDLIHITIIDNEKDVYKSLSVEFDSQYYHEWNLPIYAGTISPGEYRVMVEDLIKSMCYSPKSADFPTFDWEYARNDYYFCVESYVDAQNAFGAEIRHNFSVVYYNDTQAIVYVILDREVVADNGYVPTEKLVQNSVGAAPSQGVDSPTVDNPNNTQPTTDTQGSNNYQSNDEDLLWDALAEFCNDYNSSSGEFAEVLSWMIISPTEVELYLSTDYTLNANEFSEFDALGSRVLDDICNFVDSNYYFPETITFNLTLEYYEEDTYDDGYNDYEDNWEYSDDENTDDYWTYEENDYATLVDAVNAFCSSYTCEYGTLTAEVDDNKVIVEITVTSNSGTPINDDSYSIRQKISDDASAFVNNYADFPEQITFFVWLE